MDTGILLETNVIVGCNGCEVNMIRLLRNIWHEDSGQDLIEYSLLITFIAIACAAMVGSGQNYIRSIWTTSNSTITAANSARLFTRARGVVWNTYGEARKKPAANAPARARPE